MEKKRKRREEKWTDAELCTLWGSATRVENVNWESVAKKVNKSDVGGVIRKFREISSKVSVWNEKEDTELMKLTKVQRENHDLLNRLATRLGKKKKEAGERWDWLMGLKEKEEERKRKKEEEEDRKKQEEERRKKKQEEAETRKKKEEAEERRQKKVVATLRLVPYDSSESD